MIKLNEDWAFIPDRFIGCINAPVYHLKCFLKEKAGAGLWAIGCITCNEPIPEEVQKKFFFITKDDKRAYKKYV